MTALDSANAPADVSARKPARADVPPRLTVAYLVNQYPQPSHTFIRREIAALELLGLTVQRFTVRRWDQQLVDPRDQDEQRKTRAILQEGAVGLLSATLHALVTRPLALLRTVSLACRVGWRSHAGLAKHLVYVPEACVLRRWLERAGIKHVHAHFGTNSTTVAMLCRALGGPSYSFTVHGPDEWDKPEALAIGEKIARCAFAVVISHFGRSQAQRWVDHEHWSKIRIVHCGIDESFLNAPKTPPPLSPRLVCVGRLGQAKGQLALVEAAARLVAEGLQFEIALIGDGPMRGPIESLIARHNLHEHVKLLGWRDNDAVRREIQSSRAMVMPSFAEGLPVVFMESLALERPVIATQIAGVPELVRHGASGWLVPAGAIEPLADAMREALTMSVNRLWQMGQAGAEIVAEHHSAIREAAKLAESFAVAVQTRAGERA
ncbi:MAG TPA: glycosyltransferase [Tepidisphaeraceae bacterium]|nr:glycosyltransferase [Tepidisphaeraceae bacterium]